MQFLLVPMILLHFASASVTCPPGTSSTTGEFECSGQTGLTQNILSTTSTQFIFQIVFGIMGAIAVIIIIVAAINLIISQGSPDAITKARNTIVYAAIGLAVALSAEVIVSFVLNKL